MEPPSERTRLRRVAERAEYDPEKINEILDEALICHVGIVAPEGYPVVIPTIHARHEDTLYIHGSPASRLLRSMKSVDEICVTVTLVDGLVVARSAFHNSMNYRSVVVFGRPRIVDDAAEKLAALELITDQLIAGRWAASRPVTDKEIKGTLLVALPLGEASAKIRTGGPIDDGEDYTFPVWAGVVPLQLVAGEPIDDYRLLPGLEPPGSVTDYTR
jgi:nitroimidazol reductase NimA-like FMN-containing flavoprotein (pyridoxamine 5'-phosphate oxidase superfamily)